MIGFWFAAALLTLAVLLVLLSPLLRANRAGASGGDDPHLAIYRDQLAQLEREHQAGLISDQDTKALKLEIERQILALPPPTAVASGQTAMGPGLRALTLGLLLGLPALALGSYWLTGAPDLEARLAEAARQAQERPPLSIDDMVARLEARLQSAPDDATGWQMLGRSKRVLGRPQEAVTALRKAQALAPNDPAVLAELAQAMVEAGGGTVNAEAAALFAEVRALDPAEPSAPYFLALAAAQAGAPAEAIALWRGLIAASPEGAAWLPATRARIAETAAAAGLDAAAITPAPLPAMRQP
ncbi:MAG: hypothetical protein Tsb0016_01050 [Sphingomonadales bacterium]